MANVTKAQLAITIEALRAENETLRTINRNPEAYASDTVGDPYDGAGMSWLDSLTVAESLLLCLSVTGVVLLVVMLLFPAE